ncbi:MAG: META domain-containing protein [Bacteroidota bacterium]
MRVCLFLLVLGIWLVSCDDDSDTAANQNIAGDWHITAIHNSSPSGPTLGPNPNEIVAISFQENGAFNGTTSVNTFNGRFSVNGETLFITEMVTTEVADTPFGNAFYEALDESRDGTSATSQFGLSSQPENRLELSHSDFKFLVLQKQ